MKKLLYCAAALAMAFFAGSCQQENLEPVAGNGTVTFTVEAPANVQTKAIADGQNVDQLVYEVWLTPNIGTLDGGQKLYQADTTDFSPLLSLEKLTDLNLSYCWGLENCDFLDVLPNLERVWMRSTSIPAELWEKTIYKYNNIKILFWHESAGAEVGGWKNHEKTRTLTEAFRNWDYVEEFTSWDNISYTDTDNLY